MMEFTLVALVVCGGLGIVSCLRCYQCTNLHEPRCGVEWEFDGDEGQQYLKECPEVATACDKIVSDWQGSGQQHVYRTCWNQTKLIYSPTGCTEEDVRGGAYCHCTTDACNGGQRQSASAWWIYASICSISLILLQREM